MRGKDRRTKPWNCIANCSWLREANKGLDERDLPAKIPPRLPLHALNQPARCHVRVILGSGWRHGVIGDAPFPLPWDLKYRGKLPVNMTDALAQTRSSGRDGNCILPPSIIFDFSISQYLAQWVTSRRYYWCFWC
jgi:hypothetical protein